ncbi:YgaP family membrane protein [Pelobium manganitolerans]|uniref:YgaP family membrane protein n=1 Tax=Pelobium manganitolerans TaxID=1842495 RepID=UPI003FA35484
MITDKIEEVTQSLEDTLLKEDIFTNISRTERILSMASGSYIFLKGVSNIFSSPLLATTELILGFGLLQRGVTGHCPVTERLEKSKLGSTSVVVVER